MKPKLITIDYSESKYNKFRDKIVEFLKEPTRNNVKLRAFNPSMPNAKRPMIIAAWIEGTLVMKNPYSSYHYYNILYDLDHQARYGVYSPKVAKADVVHVDGSVTSHKINLAGLMAALR